MKHKKATKRLAARVADYDKTKSSLSKDPPGPKYAGGFHCPGSMKK